MTVSNGDVLKTTTPYTLNDGTIMQNVYHHVANFIDPVADGTVLAAIETWLEGALAYLAPSVHSTVTMGLTSVDKVAWDGAKWEVTENVGTFLATFSPAAATDPMPNQNSPYVVFKTARPKSTGMKKLFPFTEVNFQGSTVVAALVASIVDYASEVLNNIVIGVAHNLVPGVPRTAADAFLEFTLAVVDNITGTQRTRKPGVGASPCGTRGPYLGLEQSLGRYRRPGDLVVLGGYVQMADRGMGTIEHVREQLADLPVDGVAGRKEVVALVTFLMYGQNVLSEFGRDWLGCTFRQSERTCLLVVKSRYRGTQQVAFITDLNPAGCVETWLRRWEEGRVHWQDDKFA